MISILKTRKKYDGPCMLATDLTKSQRDKFSALRKEVILVTKEAGHNAKVKFLRGKAYIIEWSDSDSHTKTIKTE